MRDAVSELPVKANRPALRERLMSAGLWVLQGILALLFLFAGGSKVLLPANVLLAQMLLPLPIWFLRAIGGIEIAGALGLILPQLTHIKRFLTPLAACGLALEMIGATVVTLIGRGGALALMPLIVGILAAFVAYGRRKQ